VLTVKVVIGRVILVNTSKIFFLVVTMQVSVLLVLVLQHTQAK
jgi:hypothetical protein